MGTWWDHLENPPELLPITAREPREWAEACCTTLCNKDIAGKSVDHILRKSVRGCQFFAAWERGMMVVRNSSHNL